MLRAYGVESPYSLRELVSNTIISNPTEYASFLQKPVDEYVEWITKEKSWGGAVELGIVAKHFNVEIDSIDVQRLATYRFNHPPDAEDAAALAANPPPSTQPGQIPHPTARGIVCYTGIHYDLFVFNYDERYASKDVVLFDMDDPVPLMMAMEACKLLNIGGCFDDEDEMELVCMICGVKMTGNRGVEAHGRKTGHFTFQQVGK